MKIKKQKLHTKRDLSENGTCKVEPSIKTTKKPKIMKDEENAEKPSVLPVAKTLKPADGSVIFQYFTELTTEEEGTRINAAQQLLQQLAKTKNVEKRQKELTYTLKRLIRGCGASTNSSRAGFFTGLVAFLKAIGESEISIEQVFQTVQKELHVGATIANKEDADAVVGKILTCGALLHSGRLAVSSGEQLEQVAKILLQSTKHRTYHSSLGYAFLIELLQTLTESQFEADVWPLLQKELAKPWPKQTLQTVHCLIAVQLKFPTIISSKFMKTHFGGAELLHADSFQFVHKVFWEHNNTNILTHPAFELFGSYIASNSNLAEFWTQTVDPALETPTKLSEIETLKIGADILNNLSVEKTNIVDLLSTNFMRMLVEGLKNLKQKKDETLKAFYNEFLEALVNSCAKKETNDAQKVNVIQRLILPPGTFNIEKYTQTRIVHQLINCLGEHGVMSTFELYKNIFLGKTPKNIEDSAENWLNFERQNAGYTLQHLLAHKAVAQSYKWREQQLRFFLSCGIFYVNDDTFEICKKEACSSDTFSRDFGEQCKNMFYSSLQSKVTDLKQERKMLLQLVSFCNEKMQQKQVAKYFRVKNFDDKLQAAWKSMFDVVSQKKPLTNDKKSKAKNEKLNAESKEDKLQHVFHILLLNMGLQLYREPEMAISGIEDLLKCMQRIEEKELHGKKLKNKKSSEQSDEPEWIEVVVDLFLHLLSQNVSALRNIVNVLFPHLCESLNLSAVHQILSMLDMKDGQNPLSTKGEQLEEDEDNEEEQDDVDSNTSKTEESDDEEDDEDEDEDDNDDDEDEDDDDDDENEGVTESDKLRNAISQALIESSGAPGRDDDMDSIDLNDMTEEEGNKLDEALANVFKSLKKSGGTGAQSKKSKGYRVQTTTVMHFRIRVLDLVEIYLQQSPTLLISIEIMLALFDMLSFCVGDELKPLQSKVEKVLTKLTALKSYVPDSDLNEDNMLNFICHVIEKKAPAVAFDLTNKMRNKCIVFLIGNCNKIAGAEQATQVLALCQEYIKEFVKSRNPVINITLLSDIFNLRWNGVWTLAVALAEQGVCMQTRTFRRIQIYEILSVLYKNHELLKQNVATTKKQLKKLDKVIEQHIKALATTSAESNKLSAKEFQTLLELLLHVHRATTKLTLQSSLMSLTTCGILQELRQKVKLDSTHSYKRFCAAFKLQAIRNEVCVPEANGDAKHCSDDDGDTDDQKHLSQSTLPAKKSEAQKRKKASKDLRKEKKLKKEQRMLASSRGLNGGIPFVQPTESANEED